MREMRSIAWRLMTSYLVIIVITSVGLSLVGIHLIQKRVVAEAQARVGESLSAAREMYNNELRSVQQSVRVTGERTFLRDALARGGPARLEPLLGEVLRRERLDVLVITDRTGRVVWRPSNPSRVGDRRAADPLVQAVLARGQAVAGTVVVPAAQLAVDCPGLADSARYALVATPHARARPASEQTDGMMLAAAAPVEDAGGRVIGVAYGAILLNRRFELVDHLRQVVSGDASFRGIPISTVTLFLDDVRIATNVLNQDGTRAIGSRVSADVYDQVMRQGRRWTGRAFVVNDWYIAAYEPVRDFGGQVVGMLYVGTLEAPYVELQRRSTMVFIVITLGGAALTVGLSYLMSQRFSVPLRSLAAASRRLAHGELDTKVEPPALAELAELAESFNAMAAALRARDAKLHESASRRMMESERLAIIGKLAADVAHEINNPLQGIVTFAHLLHERVGSDERSAAWAAKIVTQAERCRLIIRGLLDFSRPRKPVVKPASVNALLEECVALVEGQARFQNIEVVRHYAPDVPEVVIDPSLMQQVFMNLILNAAEAMNGGGRLTLTTRLEDGMVETEFADTGCGVPEENLDRLFEPFFSTKPLGKGAGLGLSICFGIVKEHHGTISVESEPGRGARFVVQLPVHAAVPV